MKTLKPASKPRIKPVSASAPSVNTAKLFRNGRSQAVRLPKEFRFDGNEVAIRRDEATGDVVLSDLAPENGKKLSAKELFEIFDRAEFPKDFMADRKVHMPRELDLF